MDFHSFSGAWLKLAGFTLIPRETKVAYYLSKLIVLFLRTIHSFLAISIKIIPNFLNSYKKNPWMVMGPDVVVFFFFLCSNMAKRLEKATKNRPSYERLVTQETQRAKKYLLSTKNFSVNFNE